LQVNDFLGDAVPGQHPLARVLPFFIGLALAFRRRWPLLVWALVMGGLAPRALVSKSIEGLRIILAFAVGSYCVAAGSSVQSTRSGRAARSIGAIRRELRSTPQTVESTQASSSPTSLRASTYLPMLAPWRSESRARCSSWKNR
jgi:hypothetical protein